jgi:RNA polymerase sigma factor (sigma-70 family)
VNLSTRSPTAVVMERRKTSGEAEGPRERLEDELLAIRCLLGEPAAFDALIQRWHAPLWKYARRLTGDEDAAGETVQETWLRILRGIGRLRDPSKLRPWIFGIARRTVMDRLRDKYAGPPLSEVDPADVAGPEESNDQAEVIGQMHEELAALPVIERDVLVLFYLEELSLVELADVLEVPIGTVKSRLFRARRMLRAELVRKGVRP